MLLPNRNPHQGMQPVPKLVETILQRYEFTEEELNLGSVFTGLQRMYLQNEAAVMAEKRTTFAYNPDSVNTRLEFDGEMEFMRGYITALQFVIRMSDEREDLIQQQLESIVKSQQADTNRDKEVE